MTNTYGSTKKRLIELLNNQDHKVIVLKGKWGTGKTRLWRDVNSELYQDNKESIYVSLFGVKTPNELKLRILQNAYLNDASSVQKLFKTGGSFVNQVLKRFTGYSAEDGVLLWLPDIVKNKLIVIDDIERKHKSLDIDELMGMLDEYSENHKVRFLILLNTDKLNEGDVWASLHEKVVDVELTLDPLPSESFDIAADGNTETYLTETKNAVEILNINNIRVIRKIINTIAYVIKESDVEDVPTSNWIPSTVLLTASHYRAINNPPPFEYIKSYNSWREVLPKKEEQPNPNELSWNKLLRDLGINNPDEFENILFEYLQSGLLNTAELKAKFEEYKTNDYSGVISNQIRSFFENAYWNPHKSEDELLDVAKELLPLVSRLNYQTVTSIISTIEEELGNFALAQQFLENCLDSIGSSSEQEKLKIIDYGEKCHPAISRKLHEIENLINPPLTLVETVERISVNSSWGEKEKFALRNSTIEQYENTLKQMEGYPLSHFMTKHREWIINPYDEDFRKGGDNFIAACSKICFDDPNSRLSKIIRRFFDAHKLAEKLCGDAS